MPVAPAPIACRVTSRTSSPSRVSSECAVDRAPSARTPPDDHGDGRLLAPEGPPDAPGGDGDHHRQHGEQRHADDDGDEHPREPRGVIGVLQGALLPGRAEHVAEPVTTNSSRRRRASPARTSGRRPQIAAQAPVEQPRGDETPGQAGIVEALHPGQPRPILTRRGIDGRVGVRTQGARCGPGRCAPRPRSRSAGRRPGASDTPSSSSAAGEIVGLPRRVDDHHDDLGVGAGGEGGEGGREVRVGAQGLGRAGLPGAAADDQLAADARRCPAPPSRPASGRCRGRWPASWGRGSGAGGGRPAP